MPVVQEKGGLCYQVARRETKVVERRTGCPQPGQVEEGRRLIGSSRWASPRDAGVLGLNERRLLSVYNVRNNQDAIF
jgi:hypothetical protein